MKGLLLLLFLIQGATAQERVLDFHSSIRISAEGVLTVTERIAVQAEGREIRRGILRDFPTDYRDRLGNRVSVPFEVIEVKRNGASENWTLERLSNGARIRIGRGDVMLPRGEHVYEITYRTARQVGHFPDHDELYWNVNGNGWTFAFDHISAEVQLPKTVPAHELRAEAYTGPHGARGRGYQQMIRDGAVGFSSTAKFRPYEGMTIVVGFPKGIVSEPGLATRMGWFLSQNRGVGAGVAGLALMLGFLYWRWRVVGRDPRAGPRFPRYEAPKGLSAAAVRFIDQQGYDNRCFAAALLGLGSRGYLKIRQRADGYEIEPANKAVESLPGERSVAALPAAGRVIGSTYDEKLHNMLGTHERELKLLHEEKTFSKNRGSISIAFVIAAVTVAAMLMMQTSLTMVALIAAVAMAVLAAFWRWLPAYLVAGRKLQDEIEGLRQYLGVAERDEVARKQAPPKTPEEFNRFLPYAFALGVEKTWADRFAVALGAAAVAQAVSEWYQSSESGRDLSMSRLTDSVAALGNTISAAATPPASSSGFSGSGGSSGGGSSGGGGGGGGGSGW